MIIKCSGCGKESVVELNTERTGILEVICRECLVKRQQDLEQESKAIKRVLVKEDDIYDASTEGDSTIYTEQSRQDNTL